MENLKPMKHKLFRIIWQTFSESDEKYIDISRVAYVIVLFCALLFAGWAVFKNKQEFSMTDFGTGISLILFGGGAGIGIRAKLEDGTKKDQDKEEDK